MHVFTVFSHPDRHSLSGAVLDRFVAGLTAAGHTVDISDLYREGFDPAFDTTDVAHYNGAADIPEEIRAIQARVDKADVIAAIFPVWWWSMPAMLKGWVDRVMVNGYAYTYDENGLHPQLSGKKVVMLCPAASSTETYAKHRYDDAFERQIEYGVWVYCGLTDVTSHILFNSGGAEAERAAHLDLAERVGREL